MTAESSGVPSIEVAGCVAAHEKLQSAIVGMTDEQIRQPSLLPGWTAGHVLAHIARNADGMIRRIEAALRGDTVDQYPGGSAGRAKEIERDAARPATVIVADVDASAQRLDATFASVPDEGWSTIVRTVGGDAHPMEMLPFRRWREVEVHLVDLDLALPRLIAGLDSRADRRTLMAWALGRGEAPELTRWG